MGGILHVLASRTFGGGEAFVFTLGKAIRERDREVYVAWHKGTSFVERIKEEGFSGIELGGGGWLDFRSVGVLSRYVEAHDIRALHVHNFKDAVLCARVKQKLQGSGYQCKLVVTRHLVRKGKSGLLYNWLYKQIDSLVFVSRLVKDAFLEGKPKIDDAKMLVIHNSIPDEGTVVEVKNDIPVLLFAGRLVEEKGCALLLEAMGRLKHLAWKLYIAGDGEADYVSDLKAKCNVLGIENRIEFIGFQNNLREWIDRSDICVVPTIVSEAFSLFSLEAMARGRVIVCTNLGGQREFVEDGGTGLLVNADVDGLSVGIGRVLGDEDFRRRLGVAAREYYVREMGYDRLVERYGY